MRNPSLDGVLAPDRAGLPACNRGSSAPLLVRLMPASIGSTTRLLRLASVHSTSARLSTARLVMLLFIWLPAEKPHQMLSVIVKRPSVNITPDLGSRLTPRRPKSV